MLVSSLAFAWTHCRRPETPPGPDVILHGLACQMFANIATLGFALALVSVRAGATPVDLGFSRKELVRDIGLGLGAALAVVPWIYAINILFAQLVPEGVPADPYTLVLFAAVLGLLYYRTHRIVPSIVLHAALNAASVALAWSVLTAAK